MTENRTLLGWFPSRRLKLAAKQKTKKNDSNITKSFDFQQIMVTNVTTLLNVVKAIEDEHARGTRALESR